MFALRSGQNRRMGGAAPRVFGLSLSAEHFVLPRLLRKPVRMLSRFGRGEFTPPPYAASMLTAAFLAASSLYGAYLGGHFPAMVQGVTARSGFAVDQIKVSGNRETSEIDILDKLELDGWTSLVGFNPEEARERIVSLPWVRDAAVRKVYPDTIEVRIDERDAFAIWQHGSQLSVVEKDGKIIAPYAGGRQATLPLVIGFGAADRAADFVARVQAFPELAARVKGYIRVGERRWDLRLDNGITVKLPENQVDAALADLADLDRENALLTRDISAVDMRFGDRLVVQLTPEAAERRATALNAKPKAVKAKVEKRI
ncbi:cell division protein FtsQ [Aminobacter aminovorans]|uniref:Cell division protein FtsQ n=1 Tax=Aminobacter aminovorans TaxID=83263 RepID=A0A380WK46_AMIAI|nr:cell division protein FtsQ/DivIB [Aminobacter aminovorans]TCS24272.1 cell division protein FtsQ [Aminobacter aminovorans]SUU89220.1 cell division protein FtsQ [Aminobacter aminovorans]